jgi:hypothetical protein
MKIMPAIRRLWTMYTKTVLKEGLGITKRDHRQILTQNAFISEHKAFLKGSPTCWSTANRGAAQGH